MKKLWILFVFLSTALVAQEYNTKKGAVANGYDVVAYFSNKAVKGNKKITTKYDGVSFRFSSQENLNLFKQNPKKYIPQYGGYCAYAIGKTGEKVSINPKTFEIRDGKLYLFYNSWGTNTLELWQKEGANELKNSADKNWKKINH
ncbi:MULTISPECIES: YHS domain-containing (seleno)protein [unclassified Tenacibaculum]|uniref:YHS domain-containing (seleno)protein n=1 Tax=unclassified Tenacibaculum TaxID=2635139 RepID=UPI001F2FAC8C|nr:MULTISPECIES: YHS domain-containing (seleno)protein [unclassified Tenacibaculum]MCF2874849.1 YHS domain-containing protein [Tenacibaculum sp. Cn5-1]MCF2934085.1 YHS domain-containing protein [Tenacibaculum sp. Cn5-34]MCG7510295.1 YHS domain-containing protein [Tenacibaculum sp. Cn5-46]